MKWIGVGLMRSMAVLWLVGGAWPGPAGAAPADDLIDRARVLVEAGQYDSARRLLTPYVDEESARTDEVAYVVLLSLFSDSNPDVPRLAIEKFRRRFPESRYVPLAMMKLADFYRQHLRDPARASRAYWQFLQFYPTGRLAGEAHKGLASALAESGQYEQAIAVIHQALASQDYSADEQTGLYGILDFAKQNLSKLPPGGVTIDVNPAGVVQGSTFNVQRLRPTESIQTEEPPRPPARVERPVPDWAEQQPLPARMVELNFRRAPLEDVLDSMASQLGVAFIAGEDVHARITIINPKPVSADRAFQLLNSVLELHGYRMEHTEGIYKILPVKPSAEPETFTEPPKPALRRLPRAPAGK